MKVVAMKRPVTPAKPRARTLACMKGERCDQLGVEVALLKQELCTAKYLMATFCRRVDIGVARSTTTYKAFKEFLDGQEN